MLFWKDMSRVWIPEVLDSVSQLNRLDSGTKLSSGLNNSVPAFHLCSLFTHSLCLIVKNAYIPQVFSYKYLGLSVEAALSRSAHIDYICGKIKHMHFLRRLGLFYFCITNPLCNAVWSQCLVQLSLSATRSSNCKDWYVTCRSLKPIFIAVVPGRRDLVRPDTSFIRRVQVVVVKQKIPKFSQRYPKLNLFGVLTDWRIKEPLRLFE